METRSDGAMGTNDAVLSALSRHRFWSMGPDPVIVQAHWLAHSMTWQAGAGAAYGFILF